MPKTRSGKIMRRVLGAISNHGDVGNVMTLANPEVVEEIKKMVEGKEGTFSHIETMIPPQHQFKLKEQFPLNLKPPPGMPVF